MDNNNNNYKCDKCYMQFSKKGNLKRHNKTIHDKIKNYECDKCDMKFSTKGNLKTHKTAVHDKIKNYECDKCDYKCSQSSDLKKHNKQVHEKIKDIECKICVYKCSSNSTLKMHKTAVHDKIKKFECDICDFKCSQNSKLKRHKTSIHLRTQESKKMSLGEFKINTILKRYRVLNFKQEKTFQNLRSEKDWLLRYDFCIPNHNKSKYLLIEFDGKQHFERIKWSNIDSEQLIQDRFEYIQKCDIQKNEYAIEHKYPLLRLKYDDIDIQNKILDFLIANYDIDAWKDNQIVIKT